MLAALAFFAVAPVASAKDATERPKFKTMKRALSKFSVLSLLSILAGLFHVMAPEVAVAEQEEYARHSVELFLGGSTRFSEEEDTASGFSYQFIMNITMKN